MAVEKDDERGGCGAHEVGHQIPASVLVTSHIGARQQESGKKLDHFIECPEAHACGGAKHHQAEGGQKRGSGTRVKGNTQTLPTEPSGHSEPKGMNHLVVFQALGDEPEIVEDALIQSRVPRGRNGNQSTRHVKQSPTAEAAEQPSTEPHLVMNPGHRADDDQHHQDVKNELTISVDPRGDSGNGQIQGGESRNEPDLCRGGGTVHGRNRKRESPERKGIRVLENPSGL